MVIRRKDFFEILRTEQESPSAPRMLHQLLGAGRESRITGARW
jgi:hypothetical protein